MAALVRPAFPGATIEAWAPCLLGGSNSLFRFTVTGDPTNYVLRICSRDPSACATEVAVVRLLKGSAPVADVVHVGHMPGDAPLPYVISTWVEGITLAEALRSRRWPERALGEAVGRTLAAIGARTFARPGKLDAELNVTPWSVALGLQEGGSGSASDVALKYLDHHAGRHLSDAQRAQVLALLREYDAAHDARAPARLVHADFNPGNIIIAPERDAAPRVAGVIDWEWVHAGSPLLDVAVLLRRRGLMSGDFETAFGAGFTAAGGELPAQWRMRAATLDFLNLLELIDAPAPLEDLRLTALRQLLASLEHQRKENT